MKFASASKTLLDPVVTDYKPPLDEPSDNALRGVLDIIGRLGATLRAKAPAETAE